MSKQELYQTLQKQLTALLEAEQDFIANCAQTAALLFHSLANINWAGFYLLKDNQLVLGPFQGKLACVRIPIGRGVCGLAVQEKKPIIVSNVNEFPNHIVCDAASRSEIVIPFIKEGRVIGVLDLDSDRENNFDAEDERGLITLRDIFINYTTI